MTASQRAKRADAIRNRARLMEVAYRAFASEGLSASINEIARQTGVGPGTVFATSPRRRPSSDPSSPSACTASPSRDTR